MAFWVSLKGSVGYSRCQLISGTFEKFSLFFRIAMAFTLSLRHV